MREPCDANGHVKYRVTPALALLCHITKSIFASCFDSIYQTNSMMALKMLSESCDVDAFTNDITWMKISWCTLFQLSWPNKQWSHWWCHQHHLMTVLMKSHITPCFDHVSLTKKWCHWWLLRQNGTLMPGPTASTDWKLFHAFWLPWPNKHNCAIGSRSIIWCWCWFQKCHLTENSCCTLFRSSSPNEYN